MKKTIWLFLFIALVGTARGQIKLENTFDASTSISELSISGFKYYLMDVVNNQCRLYNTDHSLWKTINLTVPTGLFLYDIQLVSETLFNSDNKVELAYIYYSYDSTLLYYTYYTKVINENGQELLSIPGCSYLEAKSAGTAGTKMLAYVYDYSIILWTLNTQVYSLPGTLPGGVMTIGGKGLVDKPFPNPASVRITIPYQLPEGVSYGEIILMNETGRVINRYKVDRTFHELVIQTTGMPRGMYLYQVKTDQGSIGSGKFLHD
ncbi:MAG: T9SS type A sorting domain-containing protein [Bacteroidota bacterium]